MKTNGKKEEKYNYQIELEGVPILTISKDLQNEIRYLQREANGKEWSGILLYKINKGTITDLDNLEMTALHVFPMDLGSVAATNYETNEECLEMYNMFKDSENLRVGLIHDHNAMETFFSSTDTEELEDNACLYDFYLSLIVNYSSKYSAKIVFAGKRKAYSIEISTGIKTTAELPMKEASILCKASVEVEYEINEDFKKRWKVVTDREKPIVVAGFTGYGNWSEDDYKYRETWKSLNKQTSIPFNTTKNLKEEKLKTKFSIIGELLKEVLLIGIPNFLTKETSSITDIVKKVFLEVGKLNEAELDIYLDQTNENINVVLDGFFLEKGIEKSIDRKIICLKALKVLNTVSEGIVKNINEENFINNLTDMLTYYE